MRCFQCGSPAQHRNLFRFEGAALSVPSCNAHRIGGAAEMELLGSLYYRLTADDLPEVAAALGERILLLERL